MIDTFKRQLLARRQHGGVPGATRFILAACANVIAAGIGERRRHRHILWHEPELVEEAKGERPHAASRRRVQQ